MNTSIDNKKDLDCTDGGDSYVSLEGTRNFEPSETFDDFMDRLSREVEGEPSLDWCIVPGGDIFEGRRSREAREAQEAEAALLKVQKDYKYVHLRPATVGAGA